MHYVVRKFSICKDFPETGDGYVERYVACTAPVWLVATVRKFSRKFSISRRDIINIASCMETRVMLNV